MATDFPDWYQAELNEGAEVPQSSQTNANALVMRPLLDELHRISSEASKKLLAHKDRPLSEGWIEAKTVLNVTGYLLGFILSNDA